MQTDQSNLSREGGLVVEAPNGPLLKRAKSPDAGPERKRRRKVLSCYDCRRRKLQCDRAQPACSRCSKSGNAANCFYIEEPIGGAVKDNDSSRVSSSAAGGGASQLASTIRSNPTSRTSTDLRSKLEWQDCKIKQLEGDLRSRQGSLTTRTIRNLPLTPASPTFVDNVVPAQDGDVMVLRGKSFKTQFYGTTHPGAFIGHLPELSAFTRDAFEQYPAFARIRTDMGALEEHVAYAGTEQTICTDDDLRMLLPTEAETDELIQLYLQTYEKIYHVLHLPTFWEEYRQMWVSVAGARPKFIALVLVMVAAVQCLTKSQPVLYHANSAAVREKAISIMDACEVWLRVQSQKHVDVVDFQIRCILLVGKQVNARKFKRTWTETGNLLRFSMSAGLHRDPNSLRKPTSALDKELRRRIWAVVVELDTQASFDRGMVPSGWDLQTDCPPPHNLNDKSLSQDSEALPAPPHRDEYTDGSFLAIASETISMRNTLNTGLNNIRQTLSFEDINYYTDELDTHIHNIPDWSDPGADMAKAFLKLKLHQYLLIIHERQARHAASTAARTFSRMALLTSASAILKIHKSLTSSGIYAIELLCHDQLRAALSLCYLSTACNPLANDDVMTTVIRENVFSLMEDAIQLLTDRVIRWGCVQRHLWVALASYGYMRTRQDPANRMTYMREAVDKITGPYYKIIACQQDTALSLNGSSAVPPPRAPVQVGFPDYVALADGTGRNADVTKRGGFETYDEPTLLNMDEIASWTLDDWSFDPVGFPGDL